MIVTNTLLCNSNGSLSHITISASLPISIDPTFSSIPRILAGFIVIASSAFSFYIPCFIAIPAHTGKYCTGITG